MAEAAVECPRFFCHSCTKHFARSSSELKCPHCDSGFVEEIDENNPSLNASFSTDVDVEGNSSNGPSALDLLRGSLLHYIPDVGPPDGTDPDGISFFSINFQPQDDPSPGPSTSSGTTNPPSAGSRFLRISTTRRGNPSTSSGSNASGSTNETQQGVGQMPNLFLEGLLQSIISGADPSTVLGAPVGRAGAAGGNSPWGMFQLHGNPGDYAWGTDGLDDVITQLLGQLDNAGAPPASDAAIKKLRVLKITKDHVVINKDCSVCMDTFVLEDEAKELPCEHIFHIKCIDPWLELHNTCPICRTNIETQEQPSCNARTSPGGRNNIPSSASGPSTGGV